MTEQSRRHCIFSRSYSTGRVFVGIGSGVATVVTPMYLSDISPVAIRGTISVLSQLGITGGIFVSQLLGLKGGLASLSGWRFLLGLPLVSAGNKAGGCK